MKVPPPVIPEVPFARERLRLAKTTIALAKELNLSLSRGSPAPPADMDLVTVAFAVSIGHIEKRPMSPSKIALYLGIPRTTVLRKLRELEALDVVARYGRNYLLSPHRLTAGNDHLLRVYAVIEKYHDPL